MKPYRPSSGTEGIWFDEKFCNKCKKDAEYRETLDPMVGCQILADTFVKDLDDPDYPKEWVEEDNDTDPRCTAFVDLSEPDPVPVDTETLPLFTEET